MDGRNNLQSIKTNKGRVRSGEKYDGPSSTRVSKSAPQVPDVNRLVPSTSRLDPTYLSHLQAGQMTSYSIAEDEPRKHENSWSSWQGSSNSVELAPLPPSFNDHLNHSNPSVSSLPWSEDLLYPSGSLSDHTWHSQGPMNQQHFRSNLEGNPIHHGSVQSDLSQFNYEVSQSDTIPGRYSAHYQGYDHLSFDPMGNYNRSNHHIEIGSSLPFIVGNNNESHFNFPMNVPPHLSTNYADDNVYSAGNTYQEQNMQQLHSNTGFVGQFHGVTSDENTSSKQDYMQHLLPSMPPAVSPNPQQNVGPPAPIIQGTIPIPPIGEYELSVEPLGNVSEHAARVYMELRPHNRLIINDRIGSIRPYGANGLSYRYKASLNRDFARRLLSHDQNEWEEAALELCPDVSQNRRIDSCMDGFDNQYRKEVIRRIADTTFQKRDYLRKFFLRYHPALGHFIGKRVMAAQSLEEIWSIVNYYKIFASPPPDAKEEEQSEIGPWQIGLSSIQRSALRQRMMIYRSITDEKDKSCYGWLLKPKVPKGYGLVMLKADEEDFAKIMTALSLRKKANLPFVEDLALLRSFCPRELQ
jgi:hypothetical protein